MTSDVGSGATGDPGTIVSPGYYRDRSSRWVGGALDWCDSPVGVVGPHEEGSARIGRLLPTVNGAICGRGRGTTDLDCRQRELSPRADRRSLAPPTTLDLPHSRSAPQETVVRSVPGVSRSKAPLVGTPKLARGRSGRIRVRVGGRASRWCPTDLTTLSKRSRILAQKRSPAIEISIATSGEEKSDIILAFRATRSTR